MGQFEHLVFKLPPEYHNWFGFARPRGFLRGTTSWDEANVYYDFTSITKAQPMEWPHIHHCADEYLVFTGADMNNFFDFDAEVDVWLGDDPDKMEMYTLREPTIIRVPPNLYHTPINFRIINKPIDFSAIYLDGDWSKIAPKKNEDGTVSFSYDGANIRRCVKNPDQYCHYCGDCFSKKIQNEQKSENPVDRFAKFYEMGEKYHTGKFDKYVHKFVPRYHEDDRFLSPEAAFLGEEEMEGSNLRYTHHIVQKECRIGHTHMHHAIEEYYFISNADITTFYEMDAEVEISLGADPEHLETYTVTEPTVVRIPAGVWHGPIVVKRLGKPINIQPFYPCGNYGKVEFKDGKYIYSGTDLPK